MEIKEEVAKILHKYDTQRVTATCEKIGKKDCPAGYPQRGNPSDCIWCFTDEILNAVNSDIMQTVNNIIYDVFAYRLGPDEWEVAEEEFQTKMTQSIVSKANATLASETSGNLIRGATGEGPTHGDLADCGDGFGGYEMDSENYPHR